MAKANQEIQDALIRHQARLIQMSNRYGKEINAIIDKTADDLGAYLVTALPRVTPNVSSLKFKQDMAKMSKDISSIRRFGTKSVSQKVRQANIEDKIGIDGSEFWYKVEMKELAQEEIKYIDDLIHDSVPIDFTTKKVPPQSIINTVGLTPYSGGSIPQWFKSLRDNDLNRIMGTVRNGMTQSMTPNEIIKGVFNTNIPSTMRDAERLARTCTNGVANQSKMDYYKVNDDIIGGVIYTATLDARTCFIAGTMVLTDSGYKPIEMVKKGEYVIGGSRKPREVLATKKSTTDKIAIVELSNGEVLECTVDHLILSNGQWIESKDLIIGDIIDQRL